MKKYSLIIVAVIILLGISIFTRRDDNAVSESRQQEMCLDYIKKNIRDISPIEAVLGGSRYVTDMSYGSGNAVIVNYEDGHIAATLAVTCLVVNNTVHIQDVQVIGQ